MGTDVSRVNAGTPTVNRVRGGQADRAVRRDSTPDELAATARERFFPQRRRAPVA